jgi:hypothetical protein
MNGSAGRDNEKPHVAEAIGQYDHGLRGLVAMLTIQSHLPGPCLEILLAHCNSNMAAEKRDTY